MYRCIDAGWDPSPGPRVSPRALGRSPSPMSMPPVPKKEEKQGPPPKKKRPKKKKKITPPLGFGLYGLGFRV